MYLLKIITEDDYDNYVEYDLFVSSKKDKLIKIFNELDKYIIEYKFNIYDIVPSTKKQEEFINIINKKYNLDISCVYNFIYPQIYEIKEI